jgi:hypothetical protein
MFAREMWKDTVSMPIFHRLTRVTLASDPHTPVAIHPPSGGAGGCCTYRAGTPPTVVYRADRLAFGELTVSAHMFTDHMPFNYVDCLDTLAVALPEY